MVAAFSNGHFIHWYFNLDLYNFPDDTFGTLVFKLQSDQWMFFLLLICYWCCLLYRWHFTKASTASEMVLYFPGVQTCCSSVFSGNRYWFHLRAKMSSRSQKWRQAGDEDGVPSQRSGIHGVKAAAAEFKADGNIWVWEGKALLSVEQTEWISLYSSYN